MLAIEHFERGAERFPERVVVTDANDATRSVTYRQMRQLSDQTARALIAAGVAPDDPVAILSPNHPMVLTCQYGIVRAGAVWTPCNYRNTAPDNARQLATYGARWLFFHSSLAEQAAAIRAEVPSIKGAVCLDGPSEHGPDLRAWIAGASESIAFPVRKMTDPVAILSSSGTTGEPKGAVQNHHSWEALVASYATELARFDEPPVHLIVAPLTHAAGVTHWAFLPRGATNVLLSSADPDSILQAIERHRVSLIFLPPTVIYMLLAHPNLKKYDYSSLRYFLYGAAPMSVDKLKEAVAAFGPVMTQNYGQTEALMMMTILRPEDHTEILADPKLAHRIASAGRAGPYARVAIMDDEGKPVPTGERGEIVFQSALVLAEYYQNPAASAEVSRGGWHHSGDIGYLDADGYLYIVDRKRDLIISGGFNVFPGEVEQAVLAHPLVQDCAVVGVPHDKWGEMVLAAVELKPGVAFDPDELIAFCKERIGSVKAPKQIEVWETLPRSTVGKTLRRVVREKYWVGRDRKI